MQQWPGSVAPVRQLLLREVALPHLRRLVDDLGETANLMVLSGVDVRFVATVECDQILRVGDRTGRTLPAHRSSGGKAVLATLTPDDLADAVVGLEQPILARLQRELRTVRRRGYAVNDQETETGLIAVGAAVPTAAGAPAAGISVALPRARWSRDRLPEWGTAVAAAARAIGDDLAA